MYCRGIPGCVLGSVLLIVAATFGVVPAAVAEINHVDHETLELLVDQGVPVIDIRTPQEWAATGVIEGSHTLMFFDQRNQFDLDAWMARFREIVPDETSEFVLICAGGVRSAAVSRVLDQRLKFTGVNNVAKGINDYIRRGGAVVQWSQ